MTISQAEGLEQIAKDMEFAIAGGMSWISHDECDEFVRRIRAIAAIHDQDGLREALWQPIETAPRDGTRIIVGWQEHGQVRGISGARWVIAEHWADLESGDPADFEAGWCEPNYDDELCANVWLPMPALSKGDDRR